MINGTDNILYIKFNEELDFYPIGCLTSNDFTEDSETLDTTTRDNKGWKTQVATNQSYSISFSGLVINTIFAKGDFEKISYDRLKLIKRNRLIIDWKIQDSELQFIESGKGQIINLSSPSNIDEFVSFDATLQGYGEPISETGKIYSIQDGSGNSLQDGNNKSIAG